VRPESGGRAADAADAPAVPDSDSAREWTPPTKEFSAFVGSTGGGASGSPDDGARADSRGTRETAAVEVPAAVTQAVEARDVEPPPADELPPEAAGELPAADADEGVAAWASADEARGRVARVREGTRARVGKMRDEALVVLEEPPDDSGLSFVLTAAALFVVFLVILFLSTTVLR
jgi:hypothetical protein